MIHDSCVAALNGNVDGVLESNVSSHYASLLLSQGFDVLTLASVGAITHEESHHASFKRKQASLGEARRS